MSACHSQQTVTDGLHIIHAFDVANSAALTALGATLVATDVGKVVRQIDTSQFFIVASTGPAVFAQLGSVAASTPFIFGANGIATSTTARFLAPGYQDTNAETSRTAFRAPRDGTLRNARVRIESPGTGASTITYTLRVNGVSTALVVSMANTANDGSDLVNQVAILAGDLIAVRVTKSASLGNSPTNIVWSMEYV
jgi:hypothetical protein